MPIAAVLKTEPKI